jgi:hypothetical protein
VPADKVRQGAGIANFMRQLGGAFGINLLVAFFEVRTHFHADALTATQDWRNPTTQRLLTMVEQLMQRASGLPLQQQKAGAYEYLGSDAARAGRDAGLLRHVHRRRRRGLAGARAGRDAVALAATWPWLQPARQGAR